MPPRAAEPPRLAKGELMMDEYKNLERLVRDADDAVGIAYDVGYVISFGFFVFLLWFLGMWAANTVFGGDAPDIVDYLLLAGAVLLTSLGFKSGRA